MEMNKSIVEFLIKCVKENKKDIRLIEKEYGLIKRGEGRNYEWNNRLKVMGRLERGKDIKEFGVFLKSKGIEEKDFWLKVNEIKGGGSKGGFMNF